MDNYYIPRSKSFYIKFEQFYTLIDQQYNSKSKQIINIIADNIFKY